MCLTIYKNEIKSKKQAIDFINNQKPTKKDILVWKMLSFSKPNQHVLFENPYMEFKYKPDTHYYQEIKLPGLSLYEDGRFGFDLSIPQCIRIHDGLHTYSTIHYHPYFSIVVQMVIPKGSIMFISGDEIVSDNLIWYSNNKINHRGKQFRSFNAWKKHLENKKKK